MLHLLKKDPVLWVSLILAAISALFVMPSRDYFSYIDLRVLILLYSLMVIVKAFQNAGIFDLFVKKLSSKVSDAGALTRLLVTACFVFSMLMTNDVALITFVPFGIYALKVCGLEKYTIQVTVLETLAANLGSMATPIGNPQNLYLFSLSDMGLYAFFKLIFPYFTLSFLVLILLTLLIPKIKIQITENDLNSNIYLDKKRVPVYSVLFFLMVLTVLRIIPHTLVLIIIIISMLILRKWEILLKADFGLLFTFVFLFIFVGNIGNIKLISDNISGLIEGREILSTALLSQILSNVPCAMLLSGFTDNIPALIIGTNIGGLGTLIASMASVISFKVYCDTKNANPGKYLLIFSIFNFILLALFLIFALALPMRTDL